MTVRAVLLRVPAFLATVVGVVLVLVLAGAVFSRRPEPIVRLEVAARLLAELLRP